MGQGATATPTHQSEKCWVGASLGSLDPSYDLRIAVVRIADLIYFCYIDW